jgi:hypothetical protein
MAALYADNWRSATTSEIENLFISYFGLSETVIGAHVDVGYIEANQFGALFGATNGASTQGWYMNENGMMEMTAVSLNSYEQTAYCWRWEGRNFALYNTDVNFGHFLVKAEPVWIPAFFITYFHLLI